MWHWWASRWPQRDRREHCDPEGPESILIPELDRRAAPLRGQAALCTGVEKTTIRSGADWFPARRAPSSNKVWMEASDWSGHSSCFVAKERPIRSIAGLGISVAAAASGRMK
jgi:hypothetical protein